MHINVFNCWQELGVHRGSTDEEIKTAYKALAMKHHPDRPGSDEGIFHRVQEAFKMLKGGSRLTTINELKIRGNPCMTCDGLGVRRKQKRFHHIEISGCTQCGGSGYVQRR